MNTFSVTSSTYQKIHQFTEKAPIKPNDTIVEAVNLRLAKPLCSLRTFF